MIRWNQWRTRVILHQLFIKTKPKHKQDTIPYRFCMLESLRVTFVKSIQIARRICYTKHKTSFLYTKMVLLFSFIGNAIH